MQIQAHFSENIQVGTFKTIESGVSRIVCLSSGSLSTIIACGHARINKDLCEVVLERSRFLEEASGQLKDRNY